MSQRFTIDGSDRLEERLAELCQRVLKEVRAIIPQQLLRALVLGGGYGRGQGGVLKAGGLDLPYNDLEFYLFLRGNRLWNVRRFQPSLEDLGSSLSPESGLHIEFKIESIDRLRRAPVSMFSYDLVTAHRVVFGGGNVFAGCSHHLDPRAIPVSEATRLLFNRCTGLLLAKEKLLQAELNSEDADFIGRNIAKAQLALGDALLTTCKLYDWDVRVRHERLANLESFAGLDLRQVRIHHAQGLAFKLHPERFSGSRHELNRRHEEASSLARETWLKLESSRLGVEFASVTDYTETRINKWDGSPFWLNYILNLRTYGMKAALDPLAARYPRERLLRALPSLLWGETPERPAHAKPVLDQPERARNLQAVLHARSPDWRNLVAAYKEVWPSYG